MHCACIHAKCADGAVSSEVCEANLKALCTLYRPIILHAGYLIGDVANTILYLFVCSSSISIILLSARPQISLS